MKRMVAAAIGSAFSIALVGAAHAQTAQPTPKAPAGSSMVSESTTKHTGTGPNTKTKTKTVVGTVKQFDAGKKIVVTGPKKKDYSFDLDDNAAVSGDVAVGKKVKVTYSKSSGGEKVTTVALYGAKKMKSSTK